MSPRAIALIVAVVLLLTVPYWVPGVYYVNVASQILFFAIFALGLNVLVGYGGLVSLGNNIVGSDAYIGIAYEDGDQGTTDRIAWSVSIAFFSWPRLRSPCWSQPR